MTFLPFTHCIPLAPGRAEMDGGNSPQNPVIRLLSYGFDKILAICSGRMKLRCREATFYLKEILTELYWIYVAPIRLHALPS